MSILRCEAIGVVRGGKALLSGVDMKAHEGRVLAIVGPNGAGKSTLLSVLSGTVAPTTGRVFFAGKPILEHDPRWLACRRAFLRQRFSVSSAFSAAEIVHLGRTPHESRAGASRNAELGERLLFEVGLPGFGTRAYASLSGGEQQRVQLARILAQLEDGARLEDGSGGGKLLLLDEPCASLDPRHQHEVLALVRSRVERGFGAIAVLHDLALAARYADDILVLREGRVVYEGPSDQLHESVLGRVFGVPIRVIEGNHGGKLWVVEGGASIGDR